MNHFSIEMRTCFFKVKLFGILLTVLSVRSAWSQDEMYTPPIDIAFELKNNLTWKTSLDSNLLDKALFILYPAPMDESGLGYEDWRNPAYWTCKTCTKKFFFDFNNSDDSLVPTISFPFEINYTVSAGELDFVHNKRSYKLLCFSTAESNDGTGRFVSGVLGMALVERGKNGDKLIAFNPAVNYQGAFQNVDPPSRVVHSNQEVFFIGKGGVANGVSVEDYWPIYSDLFVYNQQLNQILRIRHAYCDLNCEKGSNWQTELVSILQEKNNTIVQTQTKGVLLKDAFWDAPQILNKVQINKRVIEDETVFFTLTTTYKIAPDGTVQEFNQIELSSSKKTGEIFTFTSIFINKP